MEVNNNNKIVEVKRKKVESISKYAKNLFKTHFSKMQNND
jgi:hypothetical protein